ncbi:MAG: hypothetical protein ACJATT_005874 [Myxococcota bacterium]|jgi:hypothetical protein
MNTHEMVKTERGLWLSPSAWLAGNALPTAWFVLPEPVGLTDRNTLQRDHIASLATGLDVEDARMEFLSEKVILLVYRAASRQAPAGVRFLCSSTYVKGRRSWSLSHHQRNPVSS